METTEKLTLQGLIKDLLKLRKKKESLPSIPIEPPQQHVYTIAEWNKYADELNTYNEKKEQRMKDLLHINEHIKMVETCIYKALPKAHIWFLTDCKKYAIAIQRTNWGGGSSELIIKESPVLSELPELKETIYN